MEIDYLKIRAKDMHRTAARQTSWKQQESDSSALTSQRDTAIYW